ncbi:MAG TPA: outer membrane beta-barrel family protein [Candidatus Prevotella stercoripullorum]|nr:outer membrane beta-barrel family protein [Candidatus Prevotella stercoripullorum]
MKQKLFLFLLSAVCLPVAAQTAADDSLRLDSLVRTLPEVMVSGERPVVKVRGAALVYDVNRLPGNAATDNAYDALKALPGVVETGGSLTLGGREVTVIMDGQVTNISQEQLTELLKSVPKDRVGDVEVMYNAPAKYQVKGACININFKHETSGRQMLTGEVFGSYDQSHHAAFQERASVVYSGKKFSADLMYSHDHGDNFNAREVATHHALDDGTVHDIRSFERTLATGHSHKLRFSVGYDFSDKHRLSLSYYGSYANTDSRQRISGTITGKNDLDSKPWLHDVSLDYKLPFGLNVGAEYTYYNSPQTQRLSSVLTDRELNYVVNNCQRLDIWRVYAKQEHTLNGGWGLNYGASYMRSTDNSRQDYNQQTSGQGTSRRGNMPDANLLVDLSARNSSAKKRENTVNLYAGFSKNFGNKVIIDASLAAEYYNSTAWNEWNFLPTLNLTYLPAEGHVLQLGVSSTTAYPEYWAVQDFITYSNGGYDEIVGNPALKPSHEYQASLTYVLKNKYVVTGWFSYTDDNFIQTLYQRGDELTETFRWVNFDFQQQAGLMAAVPLKLGGWYSGNFTATGVWMKHKDSDFYDIPFDRSKLLGVFSLRNDFHISRSPEITLSLNGQVQTKAIQGNYDLPAAGRVDAAVQLKFLKDRRATLKVYCYDMFETSHIDPYIRFKGQDFSMKMSSFRHVGVTFSYAFGGYKEKEHKVVDTSRFMK